MTTGYDANIPYDSVINYDGGAVITTPALLPTLALKVKSKAGVISPLPQAQVDAVSFEDSMAGAISFKVAKGTVGASLVDDYSVITMTMNGKEILDGRWLLRGKGWNAGESAQIKGYTGRSLLWDRLERTTIQPGAAHLYQSKSPGYILDQLFTEAKVRGVGYWSNFTWTFNNATDSNGKGWPTVLGSIEYLPTAKYSDIVANMVDKGLIDIHLLGDVIQVTVQASAGRVTQALLVVGKDLSDAPQMSSAENILSHVTVLGDDGVAVTRTNPDTAAAYWREEGAISQGGTKDEGTLSLFGDVALSGGDVPRVQRTYGLVITQERPFLPIRDYWVGDWVRAQHSDESRLSVRVKQIVLKQDTGGNWSGTLVLNDKFIENELRLVKKVDGIIGGATITGSSQTSTPDDLKDKGIPAPMTGFNVVTNVYQDSQGITKGIATATWNLVTNNVDGSLATDMGTYYIVWWYADQSFATKTEIQVQHPDNTVTWSNLDPGRDINAYVYSKDNNGNQGSWNGSAVTFAIAVDTIAPPTPSGPAMTTLLRLFVVEYNGLSAAGQPMPSDFSHVEVWSSIINNFDPDTQGQFHGRLNGKGQFYQTAYQWSIGTTVYFKFIAVDRSGNRSAPSAQNFKALLGVTGPDVVAGTITGDRIAVGTLTAQNIKVGGINASSIDLGQTQNLVPDPSFNTIDWRTRRLTTEWSEKPSRWFFKLGPIQRNGYYLQALSQVDGNNGGRMYITGQISCMYGETYYAGVYLRNGEFAPNSEATMYLGWEGVKADGMVIQGGQAFEPTATWRKVGYLLPLTDIDLMTIRFYVRVDDINAGDIAMDDWEVRGGVGTTATAGPRLLLTPPRFEAYNSSEQQTVLVEAETGDVAIRGQFLSGFGGKRIVINPGSTYVPEVRFYPTSNDTTFAYINAVDALSGTFPLIGVNAPDVGPSSMALLLSDTALQLGEINKSLGSVIGGGLQVNGTGGSAVLILTGKLGGGGSAIDTFSSYRFNIGTGSSTPTVSVVMTKPPNPSSGQWILIYSVQRAGTGQLTTSHINQNSTATSTIVVGSTATAASFTPNLTTVNTYINHLWIRSDGDV